MNQREIAYKIIKETIINHKYTNLLMRKELNILPPIQRPFCVELINGVLRNYYYLIYQFNDLIDNNTNIKNKIVLAMACYEKYYMHQKDYVINNEYPKLINNKYDKNFINAILRNHYTFNEINNDSDEDMAIKYSLPLWIYKLLKKQYPDDYLKIIKSYLDVSIVYYRLNKRYYSYDDLKNLDIEIINDDIFISRNNLINTEEYKEGYFYIQDINSSKIIKYLDLKKDDIFLDLCSAPGSKLFNALDIIDDNNAYCNDIHLHRLELIKQKAKILGFNNIHYFNCDARNIKEELNIKFDKILIDAPCSGLGVLKRRVDLKYHITPESLDELEKLQLEILNSSCELLKENGLLVYSTCTLNKKENEKLIKQFLKNNKSFCLLEEKNIYDVEGDYFYLAKLKKV